MLLTVKQSISPQIGTHKEAHTFRASASEFCLLSSLQLLKITHISEQLVTHSFGLYNRIAILLYLDLS